MKSEERKKSPQINTDCVPTVRRRLYPLNNPRKSALIRGHFSLLFSLFTVLCSLLIACELPLDMAKPPQSFPSGKGYFSLKVNQARTIMPDTPQLSGFAVFVLNFAPTAGGTAQTEERTYAKLSLPVLLDAGTYTLTVNAYKDAGKTQLAARGILANITINAGANISRTVNLKALIDEGSGTFRWDIDLDGINGTLTTASMTIDPRNASTGTAVQTIDLLNTANRTGSRTLNSGVYEVIFTLEKGNALGEIVIWHELLHVYAVLESVFPFDFTDAHFAQTIYTVTLKYNNGDTDGSQSVLHGDAFSKPSDPARSGYIFDGWHTDALCTVPYVFSDPVHNNVTLYAKWEFDPAVARIGSTGYATLAAAIAAAPTNASVSNPTTIEILDDIMLTEQIIIGTDKHIRLIPYAADRTISRGDGLTTYVIIVKSDAASSLSSLTIEGSGSYQLIFDGRKDIVTTSTQSFISVQITGANYSNAQLVMKSGAVVRNNLGGNGGGVANMGTFTMSGGEISGNTTAGTGVSGGGVNSSGTFNMSGGTISGNTAGGNTNYGGGVSLGGTGSTFNMSGGTISGNTAGASVNGGGVYLSGGTFTMSGGTISGNKSGSSDASSGKGVAVTTTANIFIMSGTAKVDADNDVSLAANKFITIGGTLTATAPVATITPNAYAPGRQMLGKGSGVDDAALAAASTRFAVTDALWKVDTDGTLQAVNPVAQLGNGKYPTLADAIAAVPTTGKSVDDPTPITIVADITLTAAIPSTGTGIVAGKHIKLIPDSSNRSITRGTGFTAAFFTITADASLTIEGSGGKTLTLDGNKSVVTTSTGALVHLNNANARLVMKDGAVLKNNRASNGGGVYVQNGIFDMSGGEISGNTAVTNGAGVNFTAGTFTMSGSALIDANNDVYLAASRFITIGGALSATTVATITPDAYAANREVLRLGTGSGTTLAAEYGKFAVSNFIMWEIAADGTLQRLPVLPIAVTAAGDDHSFAIDTGGNLWAWGRNNNGQLGDGTTTQRNSPVPIKAGTTFSAVSGGSDHSLAIDTDGNLWAWGDNYYGEVGDGTKTRRNSPVPIKAGTTFKAVAAGWIHSLAIDTAGNLWAWGSNTNGRLGDGTTVQKETPVQIQAGTTFSAIAAGYSHSLAIDTAGNLWAWGDNANGRLGDGTTTQRTSPVQIQTGTTFSAVAAGYQHSLAIETG
ncbi:MAG: InlB B-repeat-containing protein, partial [Treponema sp.]|nr:InlB B-repeat-containing protein [Treponema sp.]